MTYVWLAVNADVVPWHVTMEHGRAVMRCHQVIGWSGRHLGGWVWVGLDTVI